MWSVETSCLKASVFRMLCLSIDVHMSRADCHQNARVTLSAAAAEGRRMCRGRTVARTVAAQRWENLNFISLLSSLAGALGQAGQGAVISHESPPTPAQPHKS